MSDGAILGTGPNANIELQVDPTFQAMRSSIRALEYRTNDGQMIGGHYCGVFTFSNTAGGPAAGSTIFGARWRETKAPMVLKRLWAQISVTTAFTTAQAVDFAAFRASGYTAGPTSGTNIGPLSTLKTRTNLMGTSLLLANAGDLVICSGAALTNGTRTLEAQAFGYGAFGATALGLSGQFDMFNCRDFGVHPELFAANEGFEIQNGIALGAAGVCKIGIGMVWAEVPSY